MRTNVEYDQPVYDTIEEIMEHMREDMLISAGDFVGEAAETMAYQIEDAIRAQLEESGKYEDETPDIDDLQASDVDWARLDLSKVRAEVQCHEVFTADVATEAMLAVGVIEKEESAV